MQPSEPVRDQVIREVRGQAAEALAAVGPERLTRVAFFRACKWGRLSLSDSNDDAYRSDVPLAKAFEWLRIALSCASGDC